MSRDPIEVRGEIERVRRAGEWIERALFAVAAGALVFTMLNVTLFAVRFGTPWWMAWLLDPLASVALLAALVGDGVLSRYGKPCGGWGTALKWVAACGTWSMNVWASVAAGSAAGVVLHSVAPALVVLLAEAAPRYRIRFAAVLAELQQQLPAAAPARPEETAPVPASGPQVDTVELPAIDPTEDPIADPIAATASARRSGGPTRSARPARSSATRSSADVRSGSARSMGELRTELAAAIEAGRLDRRPSAEAIRRALRISPARARQLRDEHQQQGPQQNQQASGSQQASGERVSADVAA